MMVLKNGTSRSTPSSSKESIPTSAKSTRASPALFVARTSNDSQAEMTGLCLLWCLGLQSFFNMHNVASQHSNFRGEVAYRTDGSSLELAEIGWVAATAIQPGAGNQAFGSVAPLHPSLSNRLWLSISLGCGLDSPV